MGRIFIPRTLPPSTPIPSRAVPAAMSAGDVPFHAGDLCFAFVGADSWRLARIRDGAPDGPFAVDVLADDLGSDRGDLHPCSSGTPAFSFHALT